MDVVKVSLSVPASWSELGRKRAKWLLNFMARNPDMDHFTLRAIAFVRFSGMKLLTRKLDSDEYLVQAGGLIFTLDPERFVVCVDALEWMIEPPSFPWRPSRLAGGKTALPDLSDISFGELLMLENLYYGYLHTLKDGILKDMGRVLVRRKWRHFRKWELLAIFNWYAAAKDLMVRKFSDFYSGVAGDDSSLGKGAVSAKALEDSMNAQIRALTKGDITRENEILAMPCYRALTELNALAKEYRELNDKMKNK